MSPDRSSPQRARRTIVRTVWFAVCLVAIVAVVFVVWTNRDQPDLDALVQRAIAAADDGDRVSALRDLDSVLERSPAHPRALLIRAQLTQEEGDSQAALRYLQRIEHAAKPVSGTARFLEGSILLGLDRARDAETAFRKSIEQHPTFAQPRERLMELYTGQMRVEELRAVLRSLRSIRPWTLRESAYYLLAGRALMPEDDGVARMKRFLAADSGDSESLLAMARYYVSDDRLGHAAETLEEAFRRFPNDERVRGLYALVLLRQQEWQRAREILTTRRPSPDSPADLWHSYGLSFDELHDWENASRCFRQVAAVRPFDVAVHYALGLVLRELGREDESKQMLSRAEQLDRLERQAFVIARGTGREPALLAPVTVSIGRLLTDLKQYDDAVVWFEHALTIRPDDRAVSQAYERCRQLAERDPRDPSPDEIGPIATLPAHPGTNSSDAPEPNGPTDTVLSPVRLRDVAAKANLTFQYFNGDSPFKYLIEGTGGGVGVLDYDLDGWPDVYFPQGCPLPVDLAHNNYVDRLFRNRGDGTFEDVTAEAGLGDNRYSQGCSVGDFDNDGDPDLIVANVGRNTFYCNNGDGTFTDVTELVGVGGTSTSSTCAFADFNRDGLLDLYTVNYLAGWRVVCRDRMGNVTTCDPQNFRSEQDQLYLNRGDGTFENVTEQSGIAVPGGKGLGILVTDFTGDGWPDIYVANDGTPNFLFVNTGSADGIRFEERGLLSGAAMNRDGRSEAGMGVACADFNADGTADLFVTNFYQETNTLYLNDGTGLFHDATTTARLAEPSWKMLGFGTQAVDLNLDGLPDLFVANGDIADYRSAGRPWKMPAQVFVNRDGEHFTDVSRQCGDYFSNKYIGRGVVRLDWNRDGLPDLIAVHQNQPAALLTNETQTAGRPLVLELHGVQSNRDAIGATVQIHAAGRTQLVLVCGGDGYAGTNERRQFVGLGQDVRHVEYLKIHWPSGHVDLWNGVPAGSHLLCIEGREPIVSPLVGGQ